MIDSLTVPLSPLASIKPQVVQVELHPLLQEKKFRKFLTDRGVLCSSYSFSLATTNNRRSISRPRDTLKIEDANTASSTTSAVTSSS